MGPYMRGRQMPGLSYFSIRTFRKGKKIPDAKSIFQSKEEETKKDEKFAAAKLECPLCEEGTPAWRVGFSLRDLGARLRCCKCQKTSQAKQWRCSCGRLWYECRNHKDAPAAAKRKRRSKKKIRQPDSERKKRERQELVEARLNTQDDRLSLPGESSEPAAVKKPRADQSLVQRLVHKSLQREKLKRKFKDLAGTTGGVAGDPENP